MKWKKRLRKGVSLLIIAAAKPTITAIYDENNDLIKAIESEKPLSETLYEIVDQIDKEYSIERVLYAKGPGSFMGLKLSYIFLRVFSIARNIEFLGAESFVFSGDRPILSHKNRWFVKKEDGSAVIEVLETGENYIFAPEKLNLSLFCGGAAPHYILNAV